jgi:hypothetical protein
MAKQFPAPFQAGFRLIDGSDLNNLATFDQTSSETSLTTSTTQTLAAATALTTAFTQIATAGAGTAAKLPIAAPVGSMIWIHNASGQTCQIFPPRATDTIDGGSAGAKVDVGNNKRAAFMHVAFGVWLSAVMTVPST